MKKYVMSIVFAASMVFLSCDKNDELTQVPIIDNPTPNPNPNPEPEPEPQLPVLGPPVETNNPNTNYPSAFTGQTRVGSITTTTSLQTNVIATGLSNPWGIISMPDGRLLITSKGGSMYIYSTSGTLEKTITGFTSISNSGQGGLLDVAIDPNFATNKIIYWTFARSVSGGNLTAVAKGQLSNDETTIENEQVIFEATPSYNGSLHFGSRLVFDEQGYLYVSTGERSDLSMRMHAQDKSKGQGKVLRIDTNGNAAPNNPFINESSSMPQIFSYGHRNPQGLAIHPVSKELWQTEMGTRGGDEINRIESGKNYGWPVITYGLEYSGSPIGSGITQQTGMEQPTYYWDPSVSPSGMDFYTSDLIPEWKNNLFIGALSGQHIIRIYIHNNKVYGEERILAGLGERFRDVLASHLDGALYAITDSGKIYRISKQ